jgi:NAD(P)-dependent dehydrogenase (short-subunit alcohol dehydrogenase family)
VTDSTVFKNNVVIITGASLGIGKELALQLADQGARLALAARNASQLNAVAAECRARGAHALVVPTDVTDPAQCKNLIEPTVKEYGRIDTLINNAGVGMWAMFDQIQDLAIFERLMRTNYLGSVYCTFYALPYVKQTRGRIVGVSSLAGKTGVPARTAYVASKHAMAGFFDSLRIEVARHGVTVTMAYPDFVATGARFRNLGADGKRVLNAPAYAARTMTAETCARLILRGVAKRDREIYVTARGKFGQWAKLLLPNLVDRVALRAIEKGE